MKPRFFRNSSILRKWFEKNHLTQTELLVGFYKVGSGKASITWGEAVDEALCFGWIDGVRKSIDKESYCIRFTHRKAGSIWSAINIRKVNELMKKDLMHPKGLAAFDKKKDHKSKIYAYENKALKLSTAYQKKFKANKTAWAFFRSMPPSYQKTAIYRVMSAKQESTRNSRLEVLIRDSESGLRIKALCYASKKY
jgi:uncharacterized protein YdeI (YjbR/CyaY-like superfamily)